MSMFQDSDNEYESAFKPTKWKWLLLLPQKYYSRNDIEQEELEDVLAGMKNLRDNLNKIRTRMKKYLECSRQLASAAQNFAEVVGTDPMLINQTVERMEPLLLDDSAYENLVKKIKLIDNLLSNEMQKLKFIRLSREKAERKLKALRNKAVANEQKEDMYLKTIQQATREHDELLGQMIKVMSVQVKEMQEHGVTHLIKAQLQQFKLNQFQLFLNYQRLISGADKETSQDLEKLWNGFANDYANTQLARSLTKTEPGPTNEEARSKLASMLVKQQSYNNMPYKDSDFDADGYESEEESEDDAKAT